MKIVSKRFLLTLLLVLCWVAVFSQDPGDGGTGECECGRSTDGGDSGNPGPPILPGECLPCPVPIDESIMILVVIALLGGIYIIHRNNLKTKSPI
ncbi:hypothetical protein CXF59_11540 [Flavobacterium sp. ALD4]|uniref:hypothetical protein n=1 Tax=Flavobacterium sp. ALD4 TaxID=2058314 RepID=UPI000C33270C|nr:hypothetical protein [Flavobacterium sp. ALD4]PKH66564.1 hypothetical protein CXF59_11540 [Flavobacterium sp. ALD4]